MKYLDHKLSVHEEKKPFKSEICEFSCFFKQYLFTSVHEEKEAIQLCFYVNAAILSRIA